ARSIDLDVGRITVRDTRSRWGSCTVSGQLNFSWRLVLAPDFVLDYVVAHEVAHLMHKNHGKAFWDLTKRLTERTDEAKAWLNAHGRNLHRYGA
ncbi:MAG: M48 family metallopeptidase, partial [Magnetovibrio sp.]|nr:M48 family metallopeptidase [Magnetovibrio sp.]